MTAESLHETLPPLYAKWVDDLLGGPIPRESRATCGSCAMRAPPGASSDDRGTFFDPLIKCCTYLPTLYNFLSGRILSDTHPAAAEGRATVEARIARGIGVSPLGLMPTPTFALLYGNSKQSFGKARALRCPHYLEDGGRCGVWANRESTCFTWFCKHVKGHTGYAFWREGLHQLLQAVEIDLARWCLLELNVSAEMLAAAMASKAWKGDAEAATGAALDNAADPEAHAKAWVEWRGREREFYLRCAELTGSLAWRDVLAICGPEARAQARATQDAYRKLTGNDPPAGLKAGTFQVVNLGRETVRLNTYSEYDPIEVPRMVLDLLAQFDGRPTQAVLDAIAEEEGVDIAPDLVRKMADFDLLVDIAKP